jgi:two-component system sensor histidine kinase and response regulator WspE
VNELMDLFRAELVQQLAVLEGALARTPVATQELLRAAHTLKGSARIVGVREAERLGIAMEERAVMLERGDPVTPGVLAAFRRAAEIFAALAELTDEEALPVWEKAEHETIDAAVAALAGAAEPASSPASLGGGDPAMLEMFRLEVESQTAALSGGLVSLEQDPTQLDAVEMVMRAAHSIKGAARIVGIDPVVKLAHHMEDLVVAARDRGVVLVPAAIDLLLHSTDLLASAALATNTDFGAWLAAAHADLEQTSAALSGAARFAPPTVTEASAVVTQPGQPSQSIKARRDETGRLDKVATAPPNPVLALDRIVRVSVASIDKLVGLAGETLVEARRLPPLADAMHVLSQKQSALRDLLDEASQSSPERALEMLASARERAQEVRAILAERVGELEEHVRFSEDLAGRLYRETLASRMRPIGDALKGFPRLIRDLGRRLGKHVELVVIGGETGVDRDILEKIEGPLTHLVRNAVDHGVDTREERLATGKSERATLKIEARHWAGMLSVAISDDGRGIDLARIRAKAVAQGLVDADAQLSDAAALEYLFVPGFSTASEVTEISGRGVGLDVVQSVVKDVGGTVRITTELGQGTTFHLQLPLTLSVMRAVAVEIAGEPYAFPLTRVERIVVVQPKEISVLEGRQYFNLESRNIAMLSCAQLLELDGVPPPAEDLTVVVIGDRVRTYGMIVDRMLGELDLVVRPLDRRLGKVADISAAAVMSDGSPLLIVDVEDMVRSATWLLASGAKPLARFAPAKLAPAKHVLVVDDTITVREVQRQLLEARGYRASVAVDGMDGWQRVRSESFDLVITDVDMPRLDGIELVRSIRQDPRLAHLPVMIVSYRDREEDRKRGLEVGANHYLTAAHRHGA